MTSTLGPSSCLRVALGPSWSCDSPTRLGLLQARGRWPLNGWQLAPGRGLRKGVLGPPSLCSRAELLLTSHVAWGDRQPNADPGSCPQNCVAPRTPCPRSQPMGPTPRSHPLGTEGVSMSWPSEHTQPTQVTVGRARAHTCVCVCMLTCAMHNPRVRASQSQVPAVGPQGLRPG